VLTEREEANAIAIAGDQPFSGWTRTFTDPRLCAAIIDRLTVAGNIIETGTQSYRLAHARRERAASAGTGRLTVRESQHWRPLGRRVTRMSTRVPCRYWSRPMTKAMPRNSTN
jgi:hypothetical protein